MTKDKSRRNQGLRPSTSPRRLAASPQDISLKAACADSFYYPQARLTWRAATPPRAQKPFRSFQGMETFERFFGSLPAEAGYLRAWAVQCCSVALSVQERLRASLRQGADEEPEQGSASAKSCCSATDLLARLPAPPPGGAPYSLRDAFYSSMFEAPETYCPECICLSVFPDSRCGLYIRQGTRYNATWMHKFVTWHGAVVLVPATLLHFGSPAGGQEEGRNVFLDPTLRVFHALWQPSKQSVGSISGYLCNRPRRLRHAALYATDVPILMYQC